jgi:dual specificity protein kinase YAK1
LAPWGGSHTRYAPPPSKLSHSYQPTMMVEDESGTRREAVISNMRTAANVLPTPNQTYSNNPTATANRYPANFNQNQQPAVAFDTMERRTDVGNMYVPMQPNTYQNYNVGPPPPSGVRNVAAASQPVGTSFYGPSVVPSGQITSSQTRNQYIGEGMQATSQGSKDVRRNVDTWTR